MAVDLGRHHSTGVVLDGGSAHDRLFRIGIGESISILPTHLASRVSSSFPMESVSRQPKRVCDTFLPTIDSLTVYVHLDLQAGCL